MLNIEKLIKSFDSDKYPENFKVLYNAVFELTFAAIDRLLTNAKSANEEISQRRIEMLLEFAFSFIPSIMSGNGLGIHDKLKGLCLMRLDFPVIISKWKDVLCKETAKMMESLFAITELNEFSDPALLPFEGLPMKREYILQVLINANTTGDKENSSDSTNLLKYKAIKETSIYTDVFIPWLRLFHFIEIPQDFSNEKSLVEYCAGNIKYNR